MNKKVPPIFDNSQLITYHDNVTYNNHGDVVLLPIRESYFNLGLKMKWMIAWMHQFSLGRDSLIMYADVDFLEQSTNDNIARMFDETDRHILQRSSRNLIIGNHLDCLTPANQVCCCGVTFATNMVYFYNTPSPYQMLPGSGGTVMTESTLHNLMTRIPILHHTTDQTLSRWAHDANVTFLQANWTRPSERWCVRGLVSSVLPINATHWRCRSRQEIHSWSTLLTQGKS